MHKPCNSISCLVRKRCCLSPLGEVVSQCYDVFVASWCFRKWSDKVDSHLTPKFGPDWNGVKGASSYIQLFVVPLTLLTGLNLRVTRAQMKGGDCVIYKTLLLCTCIPYTHGIATYIDVDVLVQTRPVVFLGHEFVCSIHAQMTLIVDRRNDSLPLLLIFDHESWCCRGLP